MDSGDLGWWNEEWDSWSEVAERVLRLYNCGIADGLIHDTCYAYPRSEQPEQRWNRTNVNSFIKIYSEGFASGKKQRLVLKMALRLLKK